MSSPGPTWPLRAGVLGSPIHHSLSPVLHRAAYAHLGLDARGARYDAVEVTEGGLAPFLDGLGPRWRGLSLTMPLKHAVLPLLTSVSETARRVAAVNTVVLAPGRREGHNTDVPGMVAALAAQGVDDVAYAVVLGGGATARSAVAALASLTRAVLVVVRSPGRADALRETGTAYGVEVTVVTDAPTAAHLGAPLVVATTPPGPTDAMAPWVPTSPGVLFDVVYDPWPTPLAAAWASAGGVVLGGLDLLVHQAALQVPLQTGVEVDPRELVGPLRAAGEAALAGREG